VHLVPSFTTPRTGSRINPVLGGAAGGGFGAVAQEASNASTAQPSQAKQFLLAAALPTLPARFFWSVTYFR
jgi:hypothetical protein